MNKPRVSDPEDCDDCTDDGVWCDYHQGCEDGSAAVTELIQSVLLDPEAYGRVFTRIHQRERGSARLAGSVVGDPKEPTDGSV